jgi:excisionase family DNA binding protein
MHIAKRTTDEPATFPQRLLTLPEAAYYLGCTLWSVRDLIWKGELPYTRFGKRFQVDVRDLDAMIEREKRCEVADLVRRHPTQSAAGFGVPSTAMGDQNNGHNYREEGTGTKQKRPRRRLHIQTEVPNR